MVKMGPLKGEITRFVLVNAIHGIANLQIICKWSVVEAARPTLPLKRYQRIYGWMGPNPPQILVGIKGQQPPRGSPPAHPNRRQTRRLGPGWHLLASTQQ